MKESIVADEHAETLWSPGKRWERSKDRQDIIKNNLSGWIK